ncbi:MAG: DUF3572 family protein [Alphaproteobacteria bacterium]
MAAKGKRIVNRDEAEAFALHAVGHLAAQDDGLDRFSALTGIGIDEIKARLSDADFLGAVLDYVLYDDKLVQEIAAAADLPADAVLQARRLLPGYSPDYS